MKRGTTIKGETKGTLRLERAMITRSQALELRRDLCLGCGICATVCPVDAVTIVAAETENGRLTKSPQVDVDETKCNFCGICVETCSGNALQTYIDGEPRIAVVEYETFPKLTREISVSVDRCEASCQLACQESCSRRAIQVKLKDGAILGVDVDGRKCIYCQDCAAACPEGAIQSTGQYVGHIYLNRQRCPEGCQLCADICPTTALQMSDQLSLREERCTSCGACTEVCPEERALQVVRSRINAEPLKSAAWFTVVEKLVSTREAGQQLEARSRARLREVVQMRRL